MKIGYYSLIFFYFALSSCQKQQEFHEIAQSETLPKPLVATNKVVAHRGGASEVGCPDNSMEALNYSISLGLFAAECDIYITKDNKVIVAHADALDRINGFYPWEATYQQISRAGKLTNGEDIPILEDYLDRVLEAGTTILWLDVKSITAVSTTTANEYSSLAAERASEIIRDKKANNFVEFIVGRAAVLERAITASQGEWNCAYMNTAVTPSAFKSSGTVWANFSIDDIFYSNGVTTGSYSLEDYTNAGVKVSVYNVDTEMNRTWYATKSNLLYAICTNYPKAMLAAL
ncbi:MAG: glycerophosphodiester phosphodiesterase family protein [Niabella sp.]